MARADAVQNRERLLAAAREAFAESTEASLTAVAKQAGVGIGTLYRHFPTRESLIVALYRHHIERLIKLSRCSSPSGSRSRRCGPGARRSRATGG